MEPNLNYSGWEQLRLIPPSTIRLELVCYLDGPTETATVGFKVTNADDDDLMAMGVDRPIPLAEAYSAMVGRTELLIENATQRLSPF